MSNANGTLSSKKDTSTLVRAIFGPGMLLQHEDLEQLNSYTRELSRLLFSSFFGCGVVCGLVVKTGKDPCGKWSITVGSGLALECNGNPIYVPKDQNLPIDEHCQQDISGPLWVVLCGSVKCCGPRTSMCSPDDEDPQSVCTRERDCFEIRIVKEGPKCACRCPEPDPNVKKIHPALSDMLDCQCADPTDPCYQDHYGGKCGCTCDDCTSCNCVLLAELNKHANGDWITDHRVRRFIRPVLMRDPQVALEQTPPPKPAQSLTESVVAATLKPQSPQTTGSDSALKDQLQAALEDKQRPTEQLAAFKKQEPQAKADDKAKQKPAGKSAKDEGTSGGALPAGDQAKGS